MTKTDYTPPELLLFEIDNITSEGSFIAVTPEGYNTVLVFSPYFINRLTTFAIRKGILKRTNDKQNKA